MTWYFYAPLTRPEMRELVLLKEEFSVASSRISNTSNSFCSRTCRFSCTVSFSRKLFSTLSQVLPCVPACSRRSRGPPPAVTGDFFLFCICFWTGETLCEISGFVDRGRNIREPLETGRDSSWIVNHDWLELILKFDLLKVFFAFPWTGLIVAN